ncbi:MAG: serine/threonine-protein kinase [Myxococcales bacterium]
MLVCPLCRIVLAANESVCPRDGQTGREAAPLAVVPGLSKRFHFVQPFAHGDSGTLYLADEPETGRRGLLKVLPPVPRALQAERQRLRRELVKQGSLESAYLVAPFATGETEGQLWIFREWLEGVSLRVRLARQGALPQPQALSIAAQLAVALDELHRAGLLHRDLKPGHILLDAQSDGLTAVRVVDAGLCAPIAIEGETSVLGTPGYIAPEQLSGKLVSFRSDLYALGCVLYEMLTGSAAFSGPTSQAVLQAQRDGKHGPIPDNLPDGVSTLLRSLLGKDPQERPFSAQKLRRTLDPYLPDGAAVTRQPTKTFANVPDTKKVPPREPTGTLRPPAPPGAGAQKATVMGLGSPPAGGAKVSVPPPPPSSNAKLPKEATQRLEIEQIIASAPAQPRVSAPPPPPRASMAPPQGGRVSVPPPPPAGARSAPPPAPRSAPPKAPVARPASQDPTQAIDFAEVLDEGDDDELAPQNKGVVERSELTQPIRLDQVLAVAEAKKRMSVPPPSAARVSVPQAAPAVQVQSAPVVEVQSAPAQAAPAPVAPAPVAPVQAAPAPSAPASSMYEDDAATVVHDYSGQAAPSPDATLVDTPSMSSDISLDATIERPAPQRVQAESVAAADDDGPEGDPEEDEATSVSFKPAAKALISKKKTLIGRAMQSAPQPNMSLDLENSAVSSGPTPTSDYERSSEARSTASSRAEYEDTLNGTENFIRTRQAMVKQYWPYAAAALLLLSVGGGLIAALGGDDEPQVASVSEGIPTPAALPPPIVPTPAVMPLAVAPGKGEPQPSVTPVAEPLAPTVADTAADEADEESEEEEPKVARSDSDSKSSHHRSSRRESKREERAAKTASSKSSGKASDSKEERWAKARQEAQAFYAAKKYKQAAQAYEVAAKNNPTHAGTFAGLGASRLKAGDERGAVQAYQKAVQISPSTSGFHAALGRAYAAMGDKAKARAAYKRALALDPKNEAAKTALKELG